MPAKRDLPYAERVTGAVRARKQARDRARRAERKAGIKGNWGAPASAPAPRRGGREFCRVILPDSHGKHIDQAAARAVIADLCALRPKQIVRLGDHLDCAGTFSTHQRTYTNEIPESYDEDCRYANLFFDAIHEAAPDVEEDDYLEGNHEQHVERWAARAFLNKDDADSLLAVYGPEAVLRLKSRGIRYYKRSEFYMGISIPGTIRKGKCFYVHGVSHSKHATQVHLEKFGASVVHGHTHRSQSAISRTVVSAGIGAWCPGTLAKLQPLYKHTEPTTWSHGYAVQFVLPSGNFMHVQVPILDGVSMLSQVARGV